MSIASRINEITEHLENDYGVLTLAGADLTNVDKNIFNLKQTWTERLLYFMNNGTDIVWDNWEKVVGEGTELTLSNTEHAPMKVLLKGNTYQDSTTGKNLLPTSNSTTLSNGITTTVNDDGSMTMSGTATNTWCIIGNGYVPVKTIPAGTYTFSMQNTLPGGIRLDLTYTDDTQQNTFTISAGNTSRTITTEKDIKSIRIEMTSGLVSGTTYNQKLYLQLESGSSATSFEKFTNGASPNPDYPQEVHTVSGDNEVEVVGKNLANISIIGQVPSINTGNIVSLNGGGCTELIKIDNTKQYYFSFNGAMSGNNLVAYILFYGSTNNYLGYANVTSSASGYNLNTNAYFSSTYYVRIRFDGYTNVNWYQLEQNNQSTTYTPYQSTTYPINLPEGMFLGSIGDYKDRFFKTSGKNLFDKDSATYKNGYSINDSGQEVSAIGFGYVNSYIPVKPNTTYKINGTIATSSQSSRLFYYDNSKGFISRTNTISNTGFPYTFTTPNNCYYLQFQYVQSVFDANTVMLNEGSTALPYEPYGSNEWYLEKKIGKYTMPDNLGGYNSTNNWFYLGTSNFNNISTVSGTPMYCNNFKNVYIGLDKVGIYNVGTNIIVRNTDCTDLASYKTYFTNNQTIFYSPLATPTYTKIEGTLASQLEALNGAKSYTGQTNISQTNDDLPFILDASALVEE